MKRLKKQVSFIAITMLCMVIAFSSSCGTGTVIPQPVCDYGSTICETLAFLCEVQPRSSVAIELPDSIQVKIEQLAKDLEVYKKELLTKY